MGLYSGGTFRVQSRVAKNFSFTSTNSNKKIYSSSLQLWDDKIDWETVKSRVKANTKGSQAEADKIKCLMLIVEKDLTEDWSPLTTEERALIRENFAWASNPLAKTLLEYTVDGTKHGLVFEQRLDELINALYVERVNSVAGQDRVASPLNIKVSDLPGGKDIIGKTTISVTGANKGKLTDTSWNNIKALIDADIQAFYAKELGGMSYDIIQSIEGETSSVSDVIIRSAEKDQKIDINVPTNLTITSEPGTVLNELGQLMMGRTFSLKNYGFKNASAIDVGNASEFRRMSSFWFFATNENNFADVCTFVFATRNSKTVTVQKYVSWVRVLYEIMGAGQTWDGKSGRLVDYLVINMHDKKGAEGLVIKSTLGFLKDMPKGNPSSFFNASNELKREAYT